SWELPLAVSSCQTSLLFDEMVKRHFSPISAWVFDRPSLLDWFSKPRKHCLTDRWTVKCSYTLMKCTLTDNSELPYSLYSVMNPSQPAAGSLGFCLLSLIDVQSLQPQSAPSTLLGDPVTGPKFGSLHPFRQTFVG